MVRGAGDRILIALVLSASSCTKVAPTSEAPEAAQRCLFASPEDPPLLYAMCLDCGRASDGEVAERCLDRAVAYGHAEPFRGSMGKLEAHEARGDVRVARRDFAGARLDYGHAIAASRSRRQVTSREYASLLEKAADTSLALGLPGEAFGWLSQAFVVVATTDGPTSEDASRLRTRIREAASRLAY